MAADAFELDEIARPEILEPRCIQWYDRSPAQEHRENITTADSSTPKGMNPQNPKGAGQPSPRKKPSANRSAPEATASGKQPHQPLPPAYERTRARHRETNPPAPRRLPRRALHRHTARTPNQTPTQASTKPPTDGLTNSHLTAQPSPRPPRSRPESVTFFRPPPRPESVTFSAPLSYPIFVTSRPARSSKIRDLCRRRSPTCRVRSCGRTASEPSPG